MTIEPQARLGQLFESSRSGDEQARAELIAALYPHWRRLASTLMNSERRGHSLQATALVNQALVRLLQKELLNDANDMATLQAAVANLMRQVLVDHARTRRRSKRGGDRRILPLDMALEHFKREHVDVLVLDDTLKELAALNERLSQIVVQHFFGGYTLAEIADQLKVSLSTVEKDWRFARGWLRQRLGEGA